MPSFNLACEKWIPCVMPNGKRDKFGLRDVLVHAHEINEIFDPSPLITVSLHRLLLAILHRNFGPKNLAEWRNLWNRGCWDEQKLSDYFSEWHHRFDLFDKERPFYQTPELEGAEKHPVLLLAMEASSGNNATLFDHSSDESPVAISSSEAARYLVARQAFSIGLGKSNPFYLSDSPLIRGITTMALGGDSLFKTLALNLVAYNKERPIPQTGRDIPAWEQEQPTPPDKNGSPVSGYVDYLTWQSRRIHLFPEGNPVIVRYCQLQQNLKLPKSDPRDRDPFKCYRIDKDRGHLPLGINKERALWRDSHALLQTADPAQQRPELCNWLARIEGMRRNNQIKAQSAYKLSLIGLATEAGKASSVILWRHERLPLPLAYLEDEKLLAKLKESLEVAEKAGIQLNSSWNSSCWLLARLIILPDEKKKPNKAQNKDIKNLSDHLAPGRLYWSRLEVPFQDFLVRLAKDRATDEYGDISYGANTLPWWAGKVRRAACEAFEETTRSLDLSARTLKAVTRAESEFNRRLGGILKPYSNREEVPIDQTR